MADDGTILRLDSVLRFVPDEAHLGHFLFGMRAPIPHIKALFTCILRSKIANFRTAAEDGASPASRALDFSVDESMGSYALIRCERHKLNDRIAQYCREVIGSRYGVRFHAVDVTDILPPDELRDALNAVIGAQAEAGTAYYRAESESRRRLVAAQEGVAIAKVRASAVETEILELGSFLRDLAEKGQHDSYVRRRRAEVMSEARTLYVKEPS